MAANRIKVLFVGSNPGLSSPDDTPFHPSSRSRRTLDSWTKGLDIDTSYVNVCDFKTPNNRPLKQSEIQDALPGLILKVSIYSNYRIVAVGKTASRALGMANITKYHTVPHPSGRCRLLNDEQFVANAVSALIYFIKGYNNDTHATSTCKPMSEFGTPQSLQRS
jgi:hypothetical protein